MHLPASIHPIEILLVEDSPSDRLITVEALEHARILNSLNVVDDGVEAMAYLRRQGRYANAVRPDLILLDLNLPRKDGREVLAEIKTDPYLKYIPVIILTTSSADEDLVRVYSDHANGYITKPVDFNQFVVAIQSLRQYWFDVVVLPEEAAIRQYIRRNPVGQRRNGYMPREAVRILLLEDSPTDVLILEDALQAASLQMNYHLTVVERLSEAIALLHSKHFDVILTDLFLPDSTGLDTFRQVVNCSAGEPIIVVTGLSDESVGLQAIKEGAHDYLVKSQISGHGIARAIRYAIEKKGIEDQLRHSQRVEAIGQLASGVAHDFNNVVSVILGYADRIALDTQPGETLDALNEIRAAANRATMLTRQLLAFSRQKAMQAVPTDLNVVVGEFSRMMRRILGEEIRLELQLSNHLPQILADTGMLEQVILNFAVNARDAMPGGGKLTIKTELMDLQKGSIRSRAPLAPAYVSLIIRDTGCGIAIEDMPRIMEPFYTTKEAGKGTGLGLATVQSIVDQHRGWVDVESQLGIGTTFTVCLPCISPEHATPPTKTPPKETPKLAPPKKPADQTILMVEDEASLRDLNRILLNQLGYTVIPCSNAREALEVWKTRNQEIDLLFTDLVMPGELNGRTLASLLLETKPSLAVVFVTGYTPDHIDMEIELVEGLNFLQKPFSMQAMQHTLQLALAPT